MTERFYVGSREDCDVVRLALDVAFGCPYPGTTNGVPVSSGQDRIDKTNAWNALSQEQKDSRVFDYLYQGWTVRYADLWIETDPGTRFGVWIPVNMSTVISDAASAGRVLTLQQTAALLAAAAVAQPATPVDWVEPP